MSDLEGVALIITAAGTLLTATATAASIIMTALNQRANSQKLDALHVQGNSNAIRMEALAREAGVSEGNLQGREEQTAERKAEGKAP